MFFTHHTILQFALGLAAFFISIAVIIIVIILIVHRKKIFGSDELKKCKAGFKKLENDFDKLDVITTEMQRHMDENHHQYDHKWIKQNEKDAVMEERVERLEESHLPNPFGGGGNAAVQKLRDDMEAMRANLQGQINAISSGPRDADQQV